MKTLFSVSLLLFFLSNNFAQTYDHNPFDSQEIKRYYESNFLQYERSYPFIEDKAWAGKNAVTTESQETYRLIYTWNLDIPTNADITSAKLFISGTAYSDAQFPINNIQYELKKFPNDKYSAQPLDQWDAITNSNVLRTEEVPLNGEFNGELTLDQTFISYIESSLASGKFHISIRGTDEETFGTNRNIHYLDYQNTGHIVESSLRLVIDYTIPPDIATLIADNNFTIGSNHGAIKVDGINRTAPFSFNKSVGQTTTLQALRQSDGSGFIRDWNNTFLNYKSNWERLRPLYDPEEKGNSNPLNFTVAIEDDGATYKANLRKLYQISRSDQTEFDGTLSAGLQNEIFEQNSGQISAPSSQTINGKNYNFVWWTDNKSTTNPRTITPTGNQTYTTLYKYPNHSSSTTAYTNNNQKKVVRTDNGYLHKVYESMGFVWYETSSDNGVTWTIANNGKPVTAGKNPSIDYLFNYVVIASQVDMGLGFDILISSFKPNYGPYTLQNEIYVDDLGVGLGGSYSINANPVVSIVYGSYAKMLVTWKSDGYFQGAGLYCKLGELLSYDGSIYWYYNSEIQIVNGTTSSSNYPTMSAIKDASGGTFYHLAWQEGSGNTSIKYCKLTPNASNQVTFTTIENVSSGSGYTYNEQPCIIAVGDYPKIVWVGKRYIGAWEIRTVRRVKSALGWGATFENYGNNVASPTTVLNNNVIAWSENNGSANKVWRWGGIRSFGTMGKDIQISNAPDVNSMYAVGFRLISPYYFYVTPSVGSIAKENLIINNSGREGIIKKADAEFYFIIGDVSADNQTINFTEFDNDIQFENTSQLNDALVSNSFIVTDNSNLVLSVAYGTKDSLTAVNSLGSTDQLTFKIQLIDELTGELLGEYDNVTYTKDNVIPYENISYQINTSGIGNRTVVLKLIVDNNFDAEYFAADIKADAEILGKNSYTEISYKGSLAVETYDLAQNYPNPFNPSTTIKYQIPNAGNVSLKIYDILGREVTTLVDEFKNEGRYEVNFNASKLASGVYIYTIKSNDFTASKKLLLLK